MRVLGVLALAGAASGLTARADGQPFDHSAFDALLRAHVRDGMVDYDAFRKTPSFAGYLATLASADPFRLGAQERLAYWINVYNAYTIELVSVHGERDSIRNINKSLGLAFPGPWRVPLVRAGGHTYHLDNVEHDIIRKQFKEPRIHFALVCAAMGCPPLRNEAYTGGRLDAQLQDQAITFLLNSADKNRVDAAAGVVYASPIYASWYREDFGSTDAAIGRYLAGFHPLGPEKTLLLSGRFRFVQTEYDWTLNSQEKARARGAGKP